MDESEGTCHSVEALKSLSTDPGACPPCIDQQDECIYEDSGRCRYWLDSRDCPEYVEPCLQKARQALHKEHARKRRRLMKSKRKMHVSARTTMAPGGLGRCCGRVNCPSSSDDTLTLRQSRIGGDHWYQLCLGLLATEYSLSATPGRSCPIERAATSALFAHIIELAKEQYSRMSPREIAKWEQDAEEFSRSLVSLRGTSMPVVKEDDISF